MTQEKNEALKARLIAGIQEAYAMENEIAQVLQRQIDISGDHPEVQSKLTQHLAETELQRKRMVQRLEAYDVSPSLLKGAASLVAGNVVGLQGALKPEPLSGNMRDDYMTEHMEIATYASLIAVARAYGDEDTIKAAEASMKEEIAMADWIIQHLEVAVYADLQQKGVEIPEAAVTAARTPSFRVMFEPITSQTVS